MSVVICDKFELFIFPRQRGNTVKVYRVWPALGNSLYDYVYVCMLIV